MADLNNIPKRLTIGDKTLTVAAMSQRGELALIEVLKDLISEGVDIWKRFEPTLKMLEREKRWNDRAQIIELIGDRIASGKNVVFEDVLKARRTHPLVLAQEIYQRALPFHPEIDLEEIKAVVTDANVTELHLALENALGVTDDPKATRSGSPGA